MKKEVFESDETDKKSLRGILDILLTIQKKSELKKHCRSMLVTQHALANLILGCALILKKLGKPNNHVVIELALGFAFRQAEFVDCFACELHGPDATENRVSLALARCFLSDCILEISS